MFPKLLISCALFVVAAQARYEQYGYGRSPIAGYEAHLQPAITVQVLHNKYGYGAAVPAYNPPSAYSHGHASGVDGTVLRLAKLALSLPSAGHPNPAVINVPQYPSTYYSAPAVVVGSADYHASGGQVIAQSAAAAASHIGKAGSSYGPAAAY